MHRGRTGIASIVMISILIITSINGLSSISIHSGNTIVAESDYVIHDPIVIDSNDDFETQGWPGEGTFEFPYIIEGLEITGTICIDVSYTTVNFEIRDCLLITSGHDGSGVKLNELQNATIRGCKIDVLFCSGIYVDYAFNCSILENDIYSKSPYSYGIILDDLHTGEVSDNSVDLDDGGIHLVSCTNVSILRNSVNGKHSQYAFSWSESLVIRNNTINQGGFRFNGNPESYVADVSNNFVNGLPLGYFTNIQSTDVDGYLYGQIIISNSSDVKVIGGLFNNCNMGIQVAWCTNCIVDGVSASGNNIGIQLTESLNCAIYNSTIIQYPGNSQTGIQLLGSNNCTITGCESSFSEWGVKVESSSYCNITKCKIYSNSYGLCIEDGIANKIWNNKLGWNNINAEDDAPTTLWDDEIARGNSWSDYSGAGTYEISGEGGTEDRYPLCLVDNLKPTISHPEDIYYEESVEEYFITWYPSDSYPSWFRILGGAEGPWIGNQITCNVSDYVLGEYNFTTANLPTGVFNITIIVNDGAANQVVDTVLIYSILYTPDNSSTTTTSNLQDAIILVVTILSAAGGVVGVAVLVVIIMKRGK